MKNNREIRKALFENDMKQWELAKLLGVHEVTLIRKLREELPKEEQDRICHIIEEATHAD